MLRLVYVIALALLISCGQRKDTPVVAVTLDSATQSSEAPAYNEEDYEKSLRIESYVTDQALSTADSVLEIKYPCAVVINPTDEQIERMIQENGEEDFATIADDYSYYQSMASQTLDSVGVKQVMLTGRFLKLSGSAGTWLLDMRKEGMPEWNLIFFNPSKKPEIATAIDVSTSDVVKFFDVQQPDRR